MDNKIFQFPETIKALAELSADIVKLTSNFKIEKNSMTEAQKKCAEELNVKNSKLCNLQNASSGIISNLDNLISQLDNMLEKNGSSNNNN